MLTVYHAPRTRSARIIWLLEELGDVPYEVREVPFQMPTKHIHHQNTPRGKFPTIDDNGLILFESAAIIDHILAQYGGGRLAPAYGTLEWSIYRQWCAFAEGSAGGPIAVLPWYKFMEPGADGAAGVIARAAGWAEDTANVLADGLGDQDFILGPDFSAADIMLGYTANMWNGLGIKLPKNVAAYWGRVTNRAAFKKAMEGPSPVS